MTPAQDLCANLLDRQGRPLDRRFLEVDGDLRLAYAEAGEGSPVVLLHGTLTVLEDMMIPLSGLLCARHRVLAFDRPGFGRSGVRRFVDAGIWRQADRLLEALDRLGLERPVVVGHSFGASVALAMAVQQPSRLAGVVALAPLVRAEPRLEHALFGPRSPPLSGEWIAEGVGMTFDRQLFPALWRAMFLPQTMPEGVQHDFPFALAGRSESAVRVGEDAMAALPDLLRLAAGAASCPTPARILGGDRDAVVHNGTHGRLLAALMPNAVFVDLPSLGHMAHHFAGDRVAQAVDEVADRSRRAAAG